MARKIKVSILCLTFNQEEYIRQTLDGFLMQETDFDFEVLINDDASTDNTQKIIKEYEKKHGDIFKLIFQKKNLYSQGQRNFIPRFLIPRAQGQYLAICEGDDYWTDPKKLKQQVEFLDTHPDYTICFHAVTVKYEGIEGRDYTFPDVPKLSWYTQKELLKTNYIPTNSVMYRKISYKDMPVDTRISPADWYLHLFHAKHGKIKFINKVMSVYRKHEGGIWWDYDDDRDKIWRKAGLDHMEMQREVTKLYATNKRVLEIIQENIDRLIVELITIDAKYGDKLIEQMLGRFPDIGERYLLNLRKEIATKDKQTRKLWGAIHEQDKIIQHKEEMIQIQQTEINQLKIEPKRWNLRNINGKQKSD